MLKVEADEAARIQRIWEDLGNYLAKGWSSHVVWLMENEADLLKKLRNEGHEAIPVLEGIFVNSETAIRPLQRFLALHQPTG